ncbi:MAG: hypothetical protein U0136_16935 [Bdellovibrionota bacterium]
MAKEAINVKKDIKQLERVGGRAGADTIRLWEGYREQAYLWRALCLLQMPATALSIAAALVMYFFADTIIEVPERPQPGVYGVQQLPDSQFIDAATAVVNLIATYQPAVARRQFKTARKYLWEPALSEFENTMMTAEIQAIEETKRSQMFFVNPRLIKVDRYPEFEQVVVRIPGIRQKLIGSKPLPPDEMVYYVKMTTIPRNVSNEYGIVVVDIHLRRADEQQVMKEDHQEEKANRMAERKAAREGTAPVKKEGEGDGQ